MNKKALTYVLVTASIVVTCAQVVADIRIEAVGVAPVHLVHCPDQKTLPVRNFYQYKVFGHFSQLTLGDAPLSKNSRVPVFTKSAPQAHKPDVASSTTRITKAWNRLLLSNGNENNPLDIFKSSSRSHSSTGTVQADYNQTQIVNWSKATSLPQISIQGNTPNPSGQVVFCVDFVPKPPKPTGQIILTRNAPRNGDKIPMAWKIHR